MQVHVESVRQSMPLSSKHTKQPKDWFVPSHASRSGNLTIPRLELVAGHMAVNLVTNVRAALDTYQVNTHCWLDSTVALYWINGQGDYRQFVANRVQKIQQHAQVTWDHVPTKENPADLGTRGGDVVKNSL